MRHRVFIQEAWSAMENAALPTGPQCICQFVPFRTGMFPVLQWFIELGILQCVFPTLCDYARVLLVGH